MKEYIDKSAVVAEIERRKNQFVSQAESFRKIGKEDKESYYAALASNMNSLSCFLNTIEVKEVDLERECRKYLTEHFNVYEDDILQSKRSGMPLDTLDIIQVARHFFELGLKARKGE